MDTKLEYLDDSYVKEFVSRVTLVKDQRFVILDRTFFYPASGGQACDHGKITFESADGSKRIFSVLNVMKKDGLIFHEVDSPGLLDGMHVSCEIDWERRYRLMRSHTAAHILSAVFHRETGAMITGNQLDIDQSRVDFSLENFDKERVRYYFDIANEVIRSGLPISISYMKRHDVEKDAMLCKLAKGLPENILELRIVSIGDFDRQADGGTHVKNTLEIGEIILTEMKNKGAENRRVYFKVV